MAPVDSRDYVLSGIHYFVLEPRRCAKHNVACQHSQQTRDVDLMLVQCWPTVCNAGSALVQRLAAFNSSWSAGSAYCWRRVQADIDPMSVKCWASVAGAGQYLFSSSQYFMLAVPACWRYRQNALNQSWVNVVNVPTSVYRGGT